MQLEEKVLSPGATSIFEPSVPKYASKNLTLRTPSRKTPSGTPAGPSLSANDKGVSEVTIKNIENNMISLFMLESPLLFLHLQMRDHLLL